MSCSECAKRRQMIRDARNAARTGQMDEAKRKLSEMGASLRADVVRTFKNPGRLTAWRQPRGRM